MFYARKIKRNKNTAAKLSYMAQNNNAKKLETAKGVKDWYGYDAILRRRAKALLMDIFESYGYSPLETPAIEKLETLTFKGGSEIQKEIFRLTDQGKRKLGLRFDQTVPLARFVAQNRQSLKMPFKRYAISEVFRDGPCQPEQGRYRIFTQCDIDIIGVSSMKAEAELLSIAGDAINALGLGNVEIKLNNRKLLNGLLLKAGIKKELFPKALVALDKRDKIGSNGVIKELMSIEGISKASVAMLAEAIEPEQSNKKTIEKLQLFLGETSQGLEELKELIEYAEFIGIDVTIDPSLARGLDYYTGTTIEVFLKNRNIVASAIIAGGRYDNMIKAFCRANEDIPAAGISFGLERICMAISKSESSSNAKNNNANTKTPAELYVIPLGTFKEAFAMAIKLRKQGINVELDLKGRKLKKALSYADSLGIPFAAIIGEDELEKGALMLKCLATGKQKLVKLANMKKEISALKN